MKKIILCLLMALPIFAFAQETSYICGSGSKVLTATTSGGTNPVTINWTGTGGTTTGAARTVTAAGTYTWTATDANGCTASGTHVVVIEPDPTASIVINAVNSCLNTAQTISATGVPSGYIFSWNFGSGAVPTTSTNGSESVSYTTTGTKTITLTITKDFIGSTNGCSGTCTWTKTKTITIGNLTGSSSCG